MGQQPPAHWLLACVLGLATAPTQGALCSQPRREHTLWHTPARPYSAPKRLLTSADLDVLRSQEGLHWESHMNTQSAMGQTAMLACRYQTAMLACRFSLQHAC